MPTGFLLYGANGFVGNTIARLAVQQGLQPILAGRDAAKLASQATELGVECRVRCFFRPAARLSIQRWGDHGSQKGGQPAFTIGNADKVIIHVVNNDSKPANW